MTVVVMVDESSDEVHQIGYDSRRPRLATARHHGRRRHRPIVFGNQNRPGSAPSSPADRRHGSAGGAHIEMPVLRTTVPIALRQDERRFG
jgi:hypothetical protein